MLADRIASLSVRDDAVAVWALGQAGVVLKAGETVLAIDPYLSDSDGEGGRLEREFPPPLAPGDLRADVVALTHDHIDHTDPETLLALPGEPRLLGPPAVTAHLATIGVDGARVTTVAPGEPVTAGPFTLTPIPAAHEELDTAQFVGYLVEAGGLTIYHAGDTVVHEEVLRALEGVRIDVAFLPINGRDFFREADGIVGNTDIREAVELAERLDVGLTVPVHYDLFAFNGADPGQFVTALRARNPARRTTLLTPGGELYVAA